MDEKPRRWLLGAFLALLAILGLGLVFLYDPAKRGLYPSCPLYSLTGLHCPGCGTLRAIHRLLHGDLVGALSMNSLMVVTLPFLGWYALSELRTIYGRSPLPGCVFIGSHPFGLASLFILYMVVRNLPWFPFRLLAPG
jgi:Protein of unknown function (DUF2752)